MSYHWFSMIVLLIAGLIFIFGGYIIASIIVVILILYGVYQSFQDDWLYKSSQKWQKAEGKILKKDIIQELDGQKKIVGYSPYILYEYTIDNERYVSKVITLFYDSLVQETHEEAKNILRSLGHLREVDVYINPKNPEQSYLTNSHYIQFIKDKNKKKNEEMRLAFITTFIMFSIVAILAYIYETWIV